LVKVDRASMAVSLEVRCPFLDPSVIEFAWSLPLSFKVRDGIGKWIVRQVMHRYVPRELTERPKMGFSIPLATWLRGPLRPWAESLLLESKVPFLRQSVIEWHWNAFLAGRTDLADKIWNLSMLLAWFASGKSASTRDFAIASHSNH